MKKIIFGKPKGERFRGFNVEDDAVMSVLVGKKDKAYAQFLFNLHLPISYLQDSRVSRLIFKSLGIAGQEPASDNTIDMDNVLMQDIDKVIEVAKENELVDRYLNGFFKRHSDAFIAEFGYPIFIISDHDDMDNLPEHYIAQKIKGKIIYSILSEPNTQKLYTALIDNSGEEL